MISCPWCPGWRSHDPSNRGVSHGICPRCEAKMMADLDARIAQMPALRFRLRRHIILQRIQNIGHTIRDLLRPALK